MQNELVLLTDSDLPGTAAADTLAAAGIPATLVQSRDAAALIDAGREATALVVQWAPITAEVMDGMPRLRMISRLGIGPELSARLESSSVTRVIYSSCNPTSLATDLAAMPSLRPVAGRLFDMFPHTTHAEVMVLLERQPA